MGPWARGVGKRFAAALKQRRLTQASFVESHRIAASTVGDLANAKRSVTLSTFEELCKAADLSPFDVIAGSVPAGSFRVTPVVQGVGEPHADEGDLMNRPDARALIDLIPKLTDGDLEQLVFKAVELRRQRGSPAQPAPKETVHRR